jgi:hypothetical protein
LDEIYSVGEFRVQLLGWQNPRRFVVVRELLRENRKPVGRKLLDVPGYTFRIFVTNRGDAPEEIWRDYNRRADMENRIAELKHDLGADGFCLQQFFATEARFPSHPAAVQSARGVPASRWPARLPRTGDLAHASVHLWRHPRPRGPTPGAAPRPKLGRLKTRNPLIDNILRWEIPISPKLD